MKAPPYWTPMPGMPAWYCGMHKLPFDRDAGCPMCAGEAPSNEAQALSTQETDRED